MKRRLITAVLTFAGCSAFSQVSTDLQPYTIINDHIDYNQHVHHVQLSTLDMAQVAREDANEKEGTFWRISRHRELSLNLNNSGTWKDVTGGKLWLLKITAKDALGSSLYYNDFYLPDGATLHIYNQDHSDMIGAFTSANNKDSREFATGIVKGETIYLEYFEPYTQSGKGVISIDKLAQYYRGIEVLEEKSSRGGGSDPCEIDVRCPEGDEWEPQIDATVRILAVDGLGTGWCTGTVMNNTNVDCTPYVLTAWHCGQNSTTTHFNSFVFYFRRQRSGCGTGIIESTVSITGCTMRSHSGNGSSLGSDYLLVELNSGIPSNYFAYYAGWNKSTTAATSGVCTHHPAGDVKKISTFCASPVSSTWPGEPNGAHWQVQWCATVTDHGVTEGGSSGSALWDQNGRHVGQLTGGGSFCTSPNSTDKYGKMSYNWQSNTLVTGGHLKVWLDPGSVMTGDTFDGTYWPCLNDIAESVLNEKTDIYPNPTTGEFNVVVQQALDELEITIYNMVGKEILTRKMNGLHTATFDLSGYSNGIYYIRLRSGGTYVTKKINLTQ